MDTDLSKAFCASTATRTARENRILAIEYLQLDTYLQLGVPYLQLDTFNWILSIGYLLAIGNLQV
jgi:hypothetical protein